MIDYSNQWTLACGHILKGDCIVLYIKDGQRTFGSHSYDLCSANNNTIKICKRCLFSQCSKVFFLCFKHVFFFFLVYLNVPFYHFENIIGMLLEWFLNKLTKNIANAPVEL